MHIPDNYLAPASCAVMGAVMVPVWVRAIRKVKVEIPKAKIPMIGVGAAFSFLLMMFNVPLPGGTTGHAVGATLLAILLGPYAACISVSVALLLQALLFGDGGILAFGAYRVFITDFSIPCEHSISFCFKIGFLRMYRAGLGACSFDLCRNGIRDILYCHSLPCVCFVGSFKG